MIIKVYYIWQSWDEGHFAFHSPEFGWLEYLDEWDMYSPFIFKTYKELILQTVNKNSEREKLEFAKNNMEKVYLGDL